MGARQVGESSVGLLEAHLEWCALRGLRPSTIDAKRGTLDRLARAVPVDIAYANAEQVYGWYRTVQGCAQHRASELSHVRQWYKWLRRHEHRADDPTSRLDAPKVRRRLPRPILDAHLTLGLATAPEPIRTWLLCAALAGLRACEIAPLRREHVVVQPPCRLWVLDGKGDRVIPLHPELERAFAPYPESGYLFPSRAGHVPAYRVTDLTNVHLHSVGVGETLHQARHNFATKLYEASGHNLREVQEALGHQSPSATAIYTKIDVARAAVSVAAIRI